MNKPSRILQDIHSILSSSIPCHIVSDCAIVDNIFKEHIVDLSLSNNKVKYLNVNLTFPRSISIYLGLTQDNRITLYAQFDKKDIVKVDSNFLCTSLLDLISCYNKTLSHCDEHVKPVRFYRLTH